MQSIQNPNSKIQNRTKAIALAAMCLALFMTNLDDTVMNVALPKMQTSLDSTLSGLQWILNAYSLPLASLVLPSGTLGDIYGRKRVFLSGLVIFTIASAICGFAPNLGILIAGRIIQGIGAAALIPGSLSLVADTFPDPHERTKAIGIWCAVSGLALLAGPTFGGLLIDTLGWQSVFFLNLPLGVITFRIASRFVKETAQPSKRSLDVPGLLLSIIFLASFVCALTDGNTGGLQSPLIIWLYAIAGLSFVSFLYVESRSSNPILPLHLFKNPTFTVVTVVQVLVFFTLVSLLFVFSLFLQQVQGYSAAEAGLRFVPLNGTFVIASFVSGWFAARLGWRFTIATGTVMAGVAAFSLSRIAFDTDYGDIWGNLVLSGFGVGLTLSPLAAAAMSSVPPNKAGIASAILNTGTRIGSVLGITIQGTIFTQRLVSDFARSLSTWNLPSNLQEQLIADALHGAIKIPADLPANISVQAIHEAFSKAFVSGVHSTVLVASIALLAGAFLIVVFVPPMRDLEVENRKSKVESHLGSRKSEVESHLGSRKSEVESRKY
ncbi:MAG: MFS transporter [Hydrococcus sp. Prado102]|jgi:EmrB/QacA subfamily drug resistance transporter|nr:MFS transporter [Hydrococcus sp. Prado102]